MLLPDLDLLYRDNRWASGDSASRNLGWLADAGHNLTFLPLLPSFPSLLPLFSSLSLSLSSARVLL